MHSAMRSPLLRALFCAVSLTLALSACSGARLQAREGASGGQKNCASCKRMCEVAGDARDNAAAVEACKADCDKKCG